MSDRNRNNNNHIFNQVVCNSPPPIDEEEDDDFVEPGDRIRRSYQTHYQHNQYSNHHHQKIKEQQQQQQQQSETIQVKLNESYFAKEKTFVVNSLANLRQKLNTFQLFDPNQNELSKQQQQEHWNDKEKYTLDSLNELKHGPYGAEEKFQWNKPEDGREVWPCKLQYFLAITSYSVGLGNVVRFPILVQKNGGLAFLIPFVILLLVEGIPLFYLELAIGQRMRKASISCWNLISPFAAGIGLASAAVSFVIGLYYNTMVAWTLMYFWTSVTSKLFAGPNEPLPFTVCPTTTTTTTTANEQSSSSSSNNNPMEFTGASNSIGAATTSNVASPGAFAASSDILTTKSNFTMTTTTTDSKQQQMITNPMEECQLAGAYQYYWFRQTLDISGDVDHLNSFNWPIALCLGAAWLISFVCLARGLSSSKRIVYVSSTLPYVILLVFFLKMLTLPGISDGILYFIAPDWPKLFDPYVWLQAAAQVFFSLGLGYGGLIALSSYNQMNNNCYKDAIKVSLINFGTSIFAGLVLFGILGFRANLQHESCLIRREQQINYYISDYNLKVLAYNDTFFATSSNEATTSSSSSSSSSSSKPTTTTNSLSGIPELIANRRQRAPTSNKSSKSDKSLVDEFIQEENDRQLTGGVEQEDDPADLSDALMSIKNLDYQIDASFESQANEANRAIGSTAAENDIVLDDSDQEMILNASNLISKKDLDKIIKNIEDLPECSVEKELDESTQGIGFVFVVLAEAISQFDSKLSPQTSGSMLASSTWIIIFFLMILSLGFDSQFGNMEGLIASLMDLSSFAQLGRQYLTAIICLLSLVISWFAFAHGAGIYIFAIFDEFAGTFSLVLIALFELLAVSYIYGLRRFHDDCELMTGRRPNFLIMLSWRYVSPILLLIITLATMRQFSIELNYDAWLNGHVELKQWPSWCIVLGSTLIIICTIWIPLVMLLNVIKMNVLVPNKEQLERHYFPADELREYHGLQFGTAPDGGGAGNQRQFTKLERILFGLSNDYDEVY